MSASLSDSESDIDLLSIRKQVQVHAEVEAPRAIPQNVSAEVEAPREIPQNVSAEVGPPLEMSQNASAKVGA